MNKKRVVFAIDRMNIGGAPSVVFEQMKQLDKQKFEVFLVTLYQSKQANYFSQIDFLDKQHIIQFSLYKRSLFDVRTWFQVYLFLKQHKIDIVYTHLFLTNVIVRTTAWLAQVPIIIATEHSTYFMKRKWQIVVDRLLARVTKTIVVARAEIADFTARQEQLRPEKFTIIANPVSLPPKDAKITDGLSRQYQLDDQAFIILSVGRFQEEKGHRFLLQAMSQLKQFQDLHCVIVGHGPLETPLRQQIQTLGLETTCRIIVEPLRAKYFYYLANLFVLPSLREGQSLVTYEAFAAGVPVIASRLPTLQDVVIDGTNGYLVSPGNVAALAEKIMYVYKNGTVLTTLQQHTHEAIQAYQKQSTIHHLERLFCNDYRI